MADHRLWPRHEWQAQREGRAIANSSRNCPKRVAGSRPAEPVDGRLGDERDCPNRTRPGSPWGITKVPLGGAQ